MMAPTTTTQENRAPSRSSIALRKARSLLKAAAVIAATAAVGSVGLSSHGADNGMIVVGAHASPTTLVWAVPIETSLAFDVGYLYAGVVAAFTQHNKALGTTAAVDIMLVAQPFFFHAAKLSSDMTAITTFVLALDPTYSPFFGFVGARTIADASLYTFCDTGVPGIVTSFISQGKVIPNVGPQPLFSPIGRPTTITMRAGVNMELSQLVNFARHSSETLCGTAAVFGIWDEAADGAEQVATYFRQTGGTVRYTFHRKTDTFYDNMDIITAFSDPDITCIFIHDVEVGFSGLMGLAAYLAPTTFISKLVFGGSGALKAEYKMPDEMYFMNVYGAQVTPSPQDPDLALAAEFRAAMADPDVETMVGAALDDWVVNGTTPGAGYSTNSNHVAFEGYIAGRMIIETLASTPDVTRANFVNTVFRNRMMLMSGYSAGPFTKGCAVGSAFACDCNMGLKRIIMSRVNMFTGQHDQQSDNTAKGEVGVSTLEIPMDVCEEMELTMRRSLRLVFIKPTTAEAAAVLGHPLEAVTEAPALIEQLYKMIGSANQKAIDNRQLYAMQLIVADYDGSTDLNTAFLPAIYKRYMPYVVMGAPFLSAEAAATFREAVKADVSAVNAADLLPRILPRLSTISDVDASYRPEDIDFTASIADHVHALVSFAASKATSVSTAVGVDGTATRPSVSSLIGNRPIAVVATSKALLNLAVKSLHTFQRTDADSDSGSAVVGTAAEARAAIVGFLAPLLHADASEATVARAPVAKNVVVLVSNNKAITASIMSDIVPMLPKGALLLIAGDEAHITDSFVDAVPANRGAEALFASVFGSWWTASAFTDARGVYNNETVSGTLLRLQAAVSSLFVIAGRASKVDDTFTTTLYASNSYTIDGMGTSFGQFSSAPCQTGEDQQEQPADSKKSLKDALMARDPSRHCDCAKGARRISVLSLRDWANNAASSSTFNYAYELTGCGIPYAPLPEEASSALSSAIVAAIIAASVVAFLIIVGIVAIFIVVLTKGGRNHKHAPKDSNYPFAIAFTDIQSSTVLWAHAPAVMSDAVEQHNVIMREVISKTKGYEVKTIGDSFMVAFKSATDAVEFSVMSQRALTSNEWAREIDDNYIEMERVRLENERAEMEEMAAEAEGYSQRDDIEPSGNPTPVVRPLQGRHSPTSAFGTSFDNSTENPLHNAMAIVVSGSDGSGNFPTSANHNNNNNTNSSATGSPNHQFATGSGVEIIGTTASNMGLGSNCRTVNADLVNKELAADKFTPATDPSWNGLRVRVGLHYGMGDCRLDPTTQAYDYYGTLVNTAARVEGIGHGGMILVTRAVVDALGEGDDSYLRTVFSPGVSMAGHNTANNSNNSGNATRVMSVNTTGAVDLNHTNIGRNAASSDGGLNATYNSVYSNGDTPLAADDSTTGGVEKPIELAVLVVNNQPPPPEIATTFSRSDELANKTLADRGIRAHVRSMGLKPLRGLPEPIEIVEIVLNELTDRRYPPLRLDRDEEMDDVDENNMADDDNISADSYLMQSESSKRSGKDTSKGATADTATARNSGGERASVQVSVDPGLISVQPPSQAATSTDGGRTHTSSKGGVAEKHRDKMAKLSNHPPLTGMFAPTNDDERYAERVGRIAKVISLQDYMLQFRTVRAIFSQVNKSDVRGILEGVCKKWHVALPKLAKLKKAKADSARIDNYILAHLCAKVTRTLGVGFVRTAKGGATGQGIGMGNNMLMRRNSNMSCYSAVEAAVAHSNFQAYQAAATRSVSGGSHHNQRLTNTVSSMHQNGAMMTPRGDLLTPSPGAGTVQVPPAAILLGRTNSVRVTGFATTSNHNGYDSRRASNLARNPSNLMPKQHYGLGLSVGSVGAPHASNGSSNAASPNLVVTPHGPPAGAANTTATPIVNVTANSPTMANHRSPAEVTTSPPAADRGSNAFLPAVEHVTNQSSQLPVTEDPHTVYSNPQSAR